MANFCTKCGSRLELDTELCPICDAEKLKALRNKPKFCCFCGSALDINTGLCPNCAPTPTESFVQEEPVFEAPTEKLVQEEPVVEAPTESFAQEETVFEAPTESFAQEEPVFEAPAESFIQEEPIVEPPTESFIQEEPIVEAPAESFVQEEPVYAAPVEGTIRVQPVQATAASVDTNPFVSNSYGAVPINNYSNFGSAIGSDIPQPAEPQAEVLPPKRKTSASTVVSSVLLSICFFITAFLTLALFEVRTAVSSDKAEKLFNQMDVSDIINSSDDGIAEEYVDDFHNAMTETLHLNISDKEIEKFINKSTITEFASEKVGEFFEDFFENDDAEIVITAREFRNLLDDNADLIEKEFGVYPSDREINQIVTDVFDDSEKLHFIDAADLESDAPTIYNLLHIGLSYPLIIVLLVLCLLFAGLMIWNSWSQAACGIGIDFIILGTLTGIAAILAAWLTPIWDAIWGTSIVGSVVGSVIAVNGLLSLILFISGILLLIIRKVILVILYKVQRKKLNMA